MNILQIIIDILTYTPTLDGDMQMAVPWAIPAIMAAVSMASSAMSASASSSMSSKQKKAAQKNYNMLMENANMQQMTLNEQMDRYVEDMESYKSSMIQRYGLAGGVRGDDSQLKAVQDYKFGVEKIDQQTLINEAEDLRKQKIEDYVAKHGGMYERRSDKQGDVSYEESAEMVRAQAERKYDKNWSQKEMTEALGSALRGYGGKDVNGIKSFKGAANNSAILNLRESTYNMQMDINNAYKAGMIEYWQQRNNAQNVLDTGVAQAAQYSTQAQTTLASGFLKAFQYGAQSYASYKGIS